MSAANLRAMVEENCIDWQGPKVLSDTEFWTINISEQVKDSGHATRIQIQMWMLFWAEYFESEENETI